MTSEPDTPERHTGRGYATFQRRFNALLIDAAVLIASFVGLITLVTIVESDLLTTLAVGLAVAGVILYDPVLVAVREGTIGHYKLNMRVVDVETGERIGLLRALLRAWLKALLGLFSFFFMLLTRRHQSLHDVASRSAVVIHDLAAVPVHDVLYERVDTPAVRVPGWRRAAVIAAYSALSFVGYSILSFLLLTPGCTLNDVCSATDDIISGVVGIVMMLTFGVLIVLGWRGKLPGAREQPPTQA